MEKEFPHDDAVPAEILFEIADVLETLGPDVFPNQLRRNSLLCQKAGMHTNDEHFFVVTAIEDSDLPAIRQAFHATPEIIVIELLGGRGFKGKDLATLWINAGHHVFNRAILAGCV